MLDLRFIRENPQAVKDGLAKKSDKSDIDEVLAIDEKRRAIIGEVESLKAERNRVSGEIARKKKAGEPADDDIAAMKKVGQTIGEMDGKLREVETDLNTRLSWIPNLPHETVPVGADDSANAFVREWGKIEKPDFDVLPHWEIGEKLGVLDLTAAARISGSGFYVLRGLGSRLQRWCTT